MPTLTDYLETTIGGSAAVGVIKNTWVQLTNNSTAVTYVSTAATDSAGKFTVNNLPAGSYSIATGPSATGPWTATGDANYLVAPTAADNTSTFPGAVTVPSLTVSGALALTAGPVSGAGGIIPLSLVSGAAADSAVVHLAGIETITGAKTFSGAVSAKNLESIRFADQFTGASVGAQIDAAAADLSGARGLVLIPSSLGVGTWSSLLTNVSFLDLRNTVGVTNTQQISPFKLNGRVDVGQNNLSLGMYELQATGGTWGGAGIGENVALYSGAIRSGGSRGVWAANVLITSSVIPSTSPTYGLEIDVNNNSGTAATGANIFDGLAIISGGTTSPRYGMVVGVSGASGKWLDGILITNSCTDAGIVVNSGIPIGLRLQSPLQVTGMASNSAVFTPGVDNASAEIYGTNAANSLVLWQVNNDGSTSWKSAQFSLIGDAIGINPSRAAGTGAGLAVYGTVGANDARLKGNNDGTLHSSGPFVIESGAAPTVAAGQVGLGATTAATATAGTSGALPAQVAGYLIANIAGTAVKIPYYAN